MPAGQPPAVFGIAPLEHPASHQPPASSSPPRGRMPAHGWPEKDDLDYVKVAVEVLLLVLAVPWIAKHLVTNPAAVTAGAAHKHIPTSGGG